VPRPEAAGVARPGAGAPAPSAAGAGQPAVEFRDIDIAYGKFVAVRDFSLSIAKGSFVTLLGPSGCGKTTILRSIAGLVDISGGQIMIDGRRVDDVPIYKRNIGLVFQSYALFPHKNVFDNVAFGLKYRNVPKPEIARKVGQALEMVRLPGSEKKLPSQLSGGQQQRIALARALIMQPRVLLLDEPLSALDPFLRVRMREELKRLQRELKITFVHVTHAQDEAMALADLMVVMDGGVIRQSGAPPEVFERPASAFVARFIGGHNVLAWRDKTIAVRADRCTLARNGATPGLPGRVSNVEYQGPSIRVALMTSDGIEAAAILQDTVSSTRTRWARATKSRFPGRKTALIRSRPEPGMGRTMALHLRRLRMAQRAIRDRRMQQRDGAIRDVGKFRAS